MTQVKNRAPRLDEPDRNTPGVNAGEKGGMTSGSAKSIFWVGTLSSALIFIALTVDFHRREPEFAHNERITDQVVDGRKVWHKYN